MYVAHKIYNGTDSGWLVYHLRPIDRGDQQVTPLGFVHNDSSGGTWSDLRRHLPGLAYLGDVTVTADEYRGQMFREVNPAYMRRVADAAEGN